MYSSIMVPLDGTSFAEEALPAAIRLARASGARLSLVRVVDTEETSSHDPPAQSAVHYLNKISSRVLARTGVSARASVVRGDVATALCQEAVTRNCDLIVMSTHGHGALGRVFQSNVADRIARHAPCPVLFMRATEAENDWAVHKRFTHVLVPLDGAPVAEQALAMALNLAHADEARLTLLHIAKPHAVMAGAGACIANDHAVFETTESDGESHSYLQTVAEKARSQRMRSFTDVRVQRGNPANVIVEFADETAVDLIAMTTRGHHGIRRALLGSVATAVLHKSQAAVLLLPPTATG